MLAMPRLDREMGGVVHMRFEGEELPPAHEFAPYILLIQPNHENLSVFGCNPCLSEVLPVGEGVCLDHDLPEVESFL